MRLTRAALRAEAEAIHVDEEEKAGASNEPLLSEESKERAPLAEVAGNDQADSKVMAAGKKSKAKGGRKCKGKKGKNVEEEARENQQTEILEDERRAAGSPASDAAVEELGKGTNEDIVQVPMADKHPASPPSRAVRRTRRQLKAEEEQPSNSQAQEALDQLPMETAIGELTMGLGSEESVKTIDLAQDTDEANQALASQEGVIGEPTIVSQDLCEPTLQGASREATITLDVLEPKSLSVEKPNEEETRPSRSPSRSPGKTPMRLEQSIEAIDALEEAIEEVGKAIPEFEAHSSDEKSPRKNTTRAKATKKPAAITEMNAPGKCSTHVTKISRKPVSNTANVSKIRATAAARPSITRSASVRNSASKDSEENRKTSTIEMNDYLASKRRPISLSFPTPPPPPKSSKPSTKPTFQLPGEAVAAKLKAQKEERLKREEEEAAKKPVFKARPAPTYKNTTLATVKQTAASKARENMMHGSGFDKENKVMAPGVTIQPPPKRTSSINSINGKRQSAITATTKRSSSLLSRTNSIASRTTDSSNTKPGIARPAFTTSISSNSANRLSGVVGMPVAKSTVTAADAAAQRLKAREIFNRDKVEKEEREKQRKEKEEAAKRARAEAAERGRIASREWAEKQKRKIMAAMAPKETGAIDI